MNHPDVLRSVGVSPNSVLVIADGMMGSSSSSLRRRSNSSDRNNNNNNNTLPLPSLHNDGDDKVEAIIKVVVVDGVPPEVVGGGHKRPTAEEETTSMDNNEDDDEDRSMPGLSSFCHESMPSLSSYYHDSVVTSSSEGSLLGGGGGSSSADGGWFHDSQASAGSSYPPETAAGNGNPLLVRRNSKDSMPTLPARNVSRNLQDMVAPSDARQKTTSLLLEEENASGDLHQLIQQGQEDNGNKKNNNNTSSNNNSSNRWENDGTKDSLPSDSLSKIRREDLFLLDAADGPPRVPQRSGQRQQQIRSNSCSDLPVVTAASAILGDILSDDDYDSDEEDEYIPIRSLSSSRGHFSVDTDSIPSCDGSWVSFSEDHRWQPGGGDSNQHNIISSTKSLRKGSGHSSKSLQRHGRRWSQ